MNITIIDDEIIIRRIFKVICDSKGYQVNAFESPYGAIDYLQNHKTDIIFMDWNMPGVNILKSIDILLELTDVPIYIVSGDTNINSPLPVIPKPFNISSILDKIKGA
jgi:DNA-binding response OmpR family regulator